MGKLISIVGNLGAGKTTLTRLLCERGGFRPCWESPEERPFQAQLRQDTPKWAFANQMDFFLFRCEQERLVRQGSETAVMDGGFDQDFQVFTRNLLDQGNLTAAEFGLCERFYRLARQLLPPPELIIRVVVEPGTLLERRAARARDTVDRSFSAQELAGLERLLDAWLEGARQTVLRVNFDRDLDETGGEIDGLVVRIKNILQET